MLENSNNGTDAQTQIVNIKEQIVSQYSPSKVILFGSQAKGTATNKSDIDICIVKSTDKKRELLTDMYLNIDSDKPFDLLLYTEDEWNDCINDPTSFAYLVNQKGTILYG
jgi:predicted nucleotidyltransferase